MGDKRAIDLRIGRMAARQYGVVTVGQLIAAGLTRQAIHARTRAGRIHRIHRGVYAVGHSALGNEGRWLAAVLACGKGAVLSHRSAAELWRLLDPAPGRIHVTIPTNAGRKQRNGLGIHRSPHLPIGATTRHRGIAVTTPARTLKDLARVTSAQTVRRATRQAEYLGLPLGDVATDRTRSELERAFLALCRRHRLPPPETNVRIGSHTVDFVWPDSGLIVETDGYAAHRGRQAFEDDRERDVELGLSGYRVARFSARQVTGEGARVAKAVRALLASVHRPAGDPPARCS
jgi:very-short-patch-repair endonuclease